MNYADIVYFDTGNSHGISTTLFVSGCDMRCKNCHNPQAQDFPYGKPFTSKEENEIIRSLKNSHVKYFVLSGGQPSSDKNKEVCLRLLSRIKLELPEVETILYTGHKVTDIDKRFYKYCDYIIDGDYREELAVDGLDLRGSYNQKCWRPTLAIDTKNDEEKEYRVLIEDGEYFKVKNPNPEMIVLDK